MFVTPKWDAMNGYYTIETTVAYRNIKDNYISIMKDNIGSTVFTSLDELHNNTDTIVRELIKEGTTNKWFSKLPSHEHLIKRIRHTYTKLASDFDTKAGLSTIQMTPKQLTLVWTPMAIPISVPEKATVELPSLYFEDSDSDAGTEPELQDSTLPPVSLRDITQDSQEEYLLTRLRAANARVEAEQIRLEYFASTGRMPPDSDSDDEDD